MAEPTFKQTVEEKTRALAEPLVAAEGLELLDVEFVREPQGWVLRLFIDKQGGSSRENPVGLEECSTASRAVETAIDVEDFIPHEYSLEVSSPGVNRPLKKPAHYQRVLGHRVKVRTFGPVGTPPRKHFTGSLVAAGEEAVVLDVEGAGRFEIPLKDVAKANLEYEF
ncbi:MAG: ribosome maturation factor RimP [Myxococcaceae bacterium]|nr:ribosome maturation factor RimP [Myxococcaceae bacterium]